MIEILELTGQGTAALPEESIESKTIFQQLETSWFNALLWMRQHCAYIFLLWSIGFVFYSSRFLIGLSYLERLKRDNSPVPPHWGKAMEALQQRLGVRKKILLLASTKITPPLTFGWLQPVIIFPASVLLQLPMDQVESILLHELAHIKQRDYLVSLLQSVTEMLFFFNPGYWYISSMLNKERENACDDLVVATTGNSMGYAKALSKLAELCLLQQSKPALAAANNQQQLLNRIKRIIHPPKTHKTHKTMKPFFRTRGYQLAPIAIFCLLIALFTLDVNGTILSQNFYQGIEKIQLNDSSKNQINEGLEKENKIFTTISKGYYQIYDLDSKGNPLIVTMTSDSITLYGMLPSKHLVFILSLLPKAKR